jgi:PAS domain S-box-containing protein
MPTQNVVRLPNVPSLTWDDCRLLVESVVDYAIFMLDAEGRVATWNLGAEKIKGYRADEIIGQHFSTFYPEEDVLSGKPQHELDVATREGRIEDDGWRVRKDGTRFWANVVITALRDEAGKLRGFGKVTRDLTERRGVEEDLRRSEERFRLLVEHVADYAIYLLDPEGRITTWNLGAERMKGYRAHEIVGANFALFFPEEDIAAGKPARELAAAREHGRFEDEGFRIRKDGSRFWANAVLTVLRDGRGEVIGFAKITRDLTARRAAEEQSRRLLREQTAREVAEHGEARLRESEARYRALSSRLEIVLEGVADGITVQDRTGRVVFANAAAAKICGFSSGQELMNTPPAEVVARFEMLDTDGAPFDVQKLPGRLALSGKGPNSALVHVRERSSDRDWWVLIRASAVFDASGQPELAINIWHDVTVEQREERHTEYLANATAALGSSLVADEMLATLGRVLVPGLGDWCSIYLLEGKELRRAAAIHADPDRAAAAETYRQRFPALPEHAGGVSSVIRSGGKSLVLNEISDEMLEQSTTDPEALVLLRSLGMKAALLVPIVVRARILGVLALFSAGNERRYDSTDMALVEELGRRAGVSLENAQLYAAAQTAAAGAERAARVAEDASRAKDEFLAVVSHELRTPLNAIMGWAKLLTTQNFDERKRTSALNTIERNAIAMAQLIEDLLDMSRVISGKMRLEIEPVDLARVVEGALDSIRPSAALKGVELFPLIETPTPPVMGDATRLQQVVWNLLSNAVKFSSNGGHVDVVCRRRGSHVQIVVRDHGAGISPSFIGSVFDPFRQEDSGPSRKKGGLGLGLAITRQLVELHGGRISVESEGEGCGSTFTVILPMTAVATGSVVAPVNTTGETPAIECPEHVRGLRVLVVDDEEDSRALVATILEKCECVVTTAGTVPGAIAAMTAEVPDLLVSDIGMPGEDGFDLIRQVRALPRALGGDIPAAALTAYARAEDRQRLLNAGYSIHLAKPVEPAELVAVVATLSRFLHRRGDASP